MEITVLRHNASQLKKITYPKESSKTKGSMPVRSLSVSVQIWLFQVYENGIRHLNKATLKGK